jgi:peptide chain release factor 2
MRAPDFWDDQSHAQAVSTRYSRLRSRLEDFQSLASQVDDLETLLDMAGEEGSGDEVPEELEEETERVASAIARTVEHLEEQRLFTGEFDAGDAIVSIHPGAGGTESQAPPHVPALGAGARFRRGVERSVRG